MQQIAPIQRRAPKRDAILDAAQSTFLELGYAAASMDLVAARAGVSKATIYAHFAGKGALFAAIVQRRCEREFLNADAWPAGADARTTLHAVGAHLLELLMSPETVALYRVVVSEAARQPDLAAAFWDSGPSRGRARMIELFADLAARGQLAVPDPWVAADQFVGMLRSEVFFRALLGLPPTEGRDAAATVAAAVETMLKAYGVG
jgi:TetR/AcrR family transcriptional repressor of mexJK operon